MCSFVLLTYVLCEPVAPYTAFCAGKGMFKALQCVVFILFFSIVLCLSVVL